jgi:serine/threonine-protein kinase SRPK3
MSNISDSITENTDIDSSDNINSIISSSSDDNIDQPDNLNLQGCKLRHYNIIYKIGSGSYSIVWLVYNIIDKKFYALKVQNPQEYKEGIQEINFVQRLPKTPKVFNNLIEYFIENKNNNKYLCSVWALHCCNLDNIIRKSKFTNGLPFNLVNKIMNQLIEALKILHLKFKVFHGDIKTDNILIKGINEKNKMIIDKYIKLYNNNNHKEITELILKDVENISINEIDDKYIINMEISLADFGTYCDINSEYEGSFGTRYYQAPEIILMGKCSLPVDIWALGCTLFELITCELLFDPNKDSKYSRDYYHLCLINQTCGNFPINFLKKTKYYQNFFSSSYKIIDFNNTEYNRLDRKLSKIKLEKINEIKKIILNMLEIDLNKRCNILQLEKLWNLI